MKKISKNNIIFIILVVLTLIRLWLGVRTPLLLQADARYDDFLFVRYAEELLNGNWLGNDSLLFLQLSYSLLLLLSSVSVSKEMWEERHWCGHWSEVWRCRSSG